MSHFFSKLRDVALLLTVVPLVAAVIALDRRLQLSWRWLGLLQHRRAQGWSLPRTMDELVANPHVILECLKDSGSAPRDAVFLSFAAGGGSVTEPGKDKSTVKGVLTYQLSNGGKETTRRNIFIKIPTGRGVSAFFRAIAATFVPEHKEIGFYNKIVPALKVITKASRCPEEKKDAGVQPGVPLNVPLCLYAGRDRWLDRTFLIFEEIDITELVPIPDWKGVTTNQLLTQLQNVSVLHSLSWQTCNSTTSSSPNRSPIGDAISFIKDKRGITWLEGVMGLVQHHMTPSERSIWNALVNLFHNTSLSDVPMCLSHADCRPGNMLFRRGSEVAAAPEKNNCVVTDWEACAITPYLWDCAYAMVLGLDTQKRRSEQRQIVATYLKMLEDSVPKEGGLATKRVPTIDEAMRLLPWVYLLVQYYAWILDRIGGVGDEQGNSSNDMTIWRQRVREMLRLDVFGASEGDADDNGEVLRHDAPVIAALLKEPGVTPKTLIEFQRKVLKALV